MADSAESRKPRVIVVDDEPVMRQLVSRIAESLGCDVVAMAEDDAGAMRAFKAHKPDLTFLDIKLGRSNGLDVLKRISGIAPDAAVVMLTAMEDPTVAEHCLTQGAQGYVVKGGGPDGIEKAVAEQLRLWGDRSPPKPAGG